MKKRNKRHYTEWKAARKKVLVKIVDWKNVRAKIIERLEGYRPSLYEDWPVPWGDHPTT